MKGKIEKTEPEESPSEILYGKSKQDDIADKEYLKDKISKQFKDYDFDINKIKGYYFKLLYKSNE